MLRKPFRFTHFRKNASATPLVSHTFKTKDLKPFRFTHFQKKGGSLFPNIQHRTSNLRSSLSDHPARVVVPSEHRESRDLYLRLTPLDSALTSKRAAKSFTSNTYEKHTQGEGGLVAQASACVRRRSRSSLAFRFGSPTAIPRPGRGAGPGCPAQQCG